MARALFEDTFGIDINSIYADKVRKFSEAETQRLESMLLRLEAQEPVQYVTSKALFGGLTLSVGPGVLIPRPETLELAQWAASESPAAARVLDLGTGSGCIAIYMAQNVSGAKVTAVDISEKALAIAKANAEKTGCNINFVKTDMLSATDFGRKKFNVIVSNPPYVRESEKSGMHDNVLRYEPAEALFVSDADPIVFYKAIARIATRNLVRQGAVYAELNSALAHNTKRLFEQAGFSSVELRRDMQGKPRILKAILK